MQTATSQPVLTSVSTGPFTDLTLNPNSALFLSTALLSLSAAFCHARVHLKRILQIHSHVHTASK